MKLLLLLGLAAVAVAAPAKDPETGLKVGKGTKANLDESIKTLVDQGVEPGKAKKVAHKNLERMAKLMQCRAKLEKMRPKRQAEAEKAEEQADDGELRTSFADEDLEPKDVADLLDACKAQLHAKSGSKSADKPKRQAFEHGRHGNHSHEHPHHGNHSHEHGNMTELIKRAADLNCHNHDGLLWDTTIYLDRSALPTAGQKSAVECAIKEFKEVLNFFKFVWADGQCTAGSAKSKNCMKFKGTDHIPAGNQNSCNGHSHVGKMAQHPHEVFLSDCRWPEEVLCPIMKHELLHALGVHHEQSRPDRDQKMSVRMQNVRPGYENNFDKDDWVMLDQKSCGAYDPDSIMHYGAKTFSINGQEVMHMYDRSKAATIGKAKKLSQGDIRGLYNIYHCGPANACLISNGKGGYTELKQGQTMQKGDAIFGQYFGSDMKLGMKCGRNGFNNNVLHAFPAGAFYKSKFYANNVDIPTTKFGNVKFTAEEKEDGSTSYGIRG